MKHLHHTILWQNLDQAGADYCCLSDHYSGWQLAGTALLALDGCPTQVQYRVICDRLWRTRKVNVVVDMGPTIQTLHLTVDHRQRWWLAGRELESLRGCLDVDLGVTPATNTLPIRRLRLAVGRRAKITVAWVRFPGLEIRPLPQRYTRLAEHRYRYESGSSSFVTEIEVDEVGLVTHYPDSWERIA